MNEDIVHFLNEQLPFFRHFAYVLFSYTHIHKLWLHFHRITYTILHQFYETFILVF